MALDLPAVIARYFEAQNSRDTAAAVATFADKAAVHDEGRVLQGPAAIQGWLEETGRKYQAVATPTAVADRDGRTVVTASVAGHFPGSPISLDFRFAIAGGKITALDIG